MPMCYLLPTLPIQTVTFIYYSRDWYNLAKIYRSKIIPASNATTQLIYCSLTGTIKKYQIENGLPGLPGDWHFCNTVHSPFFCKKFQNNYHFFYDKNNSERDLAQNIMDLNDCGFQMATNHTGFTISNNISKEVCIVTCALDPA
jgi:hypothetical protein